MTEMQMLTLIAHKIDCVMVTSVVILIITAVGLVKVWIKG